MPEFDPRAELAPRDIVSRAITTVMHRTHHSNVYLELSHLDPAMVLSRFPVVGVGLPGHFVVEHRPQRGEPRLIDVFDGGTRLSRDDAAEKVRANSGEELRPDHLEPAGRRQILQRVLRNLLGVAREARDREAVLRYLEALVAVAPDEARDRGLLAVARFESGRREAAIEALDWFLDHAPPGIDMEQIAELKRRFREAPIPPL